MSQARAQATADHGARARLLDAATVLFAEKGYAATSVGEIVARAGVTKPVLYYYFQSKEGIFQAILGEAARLQGDVLAHALEEHGHVLDRIIGLCERIYHEVLERPYLFRLLHNVAFAPPQGAPQFDLEPFHRRMVEALQGTLSEAMARGELAETDPEDAAFLVLGVLGFCLDLDQWYPLRADATRIARLLTLAFRGLQAAPHTASPTIPSPSMACDELPSGLSLRVEDSQVGEGDLPTAPAAQAGGGGEQGEEREFPGGVKSGKVKR